MTRHPSSFRDPKGFLFERDGTLYRQVNRGYAEEYDRLAEVGGLFEELIGAGLLVAHEEVDVPGADPAIAHRILRPELIPFISYPYEWSFSQLQDAALLTLEIQKRALARGFCLKDASSYNVQFVGCRPVFIDTLSFESYREGEPWVAYRQFCQHFLAPLALAAKVDVRLTKLLRSWIDGVPLDLASELLPRSSWLRFGLLSHLHLHARAQRKHADQGATPPGKRAAQSTKGNAEPAKGGAKPAKVRELSRKRLMTLLENLESTVRGLRWKLPVTEWGDYYADTNYSDEAMRSKLELLGEWASGLSQGLILDLGANTGVFTRKALESARAAHPESARAIHAVACDIDAVAVERSYLSGREEGDGILPLVMDLTNPSPALGWHHRERDSLLDRGPADLVLALALVHHLAISNNVPLDVLAGFFRGAAQNLIIEFVPKSDSQVQRLLATREDVFPDYEQEAFERAFSTVFAIERSEPIPGSERRLYAMAAR